MENKNVFEHQPVLLGECLEGLNINPKGVYVDGTLGGAGHSVEIARRLTTGRLIGIDKDPNALQAAAKRLEGLPAQVVQGDFGDMAEILHRLKVPEVNGILLDLGVSSHQLDTPGRGFSYHQDGPLDMRMAGAGAGAMEIVATYTAEELTRIFRLYGEEKFAPQIARKIVLAREQAPVETTGRLVELIKEAIPAAARRKGGHPAKRVFQALRIEVNKELDTLERFLNTVFDLLAPKGRVAIITFHSLEDRMVKQAFARLIGGCTCPPDFPVCVCGKQPVAKTVNRKPIAPGEKEVEENNRARSAKLRVLERL